jgi:hypothetical protein
MNDENNSLKHWYVQQNPENVERSCYGEQGDGDGCKISGHSSENHDDGEAEETCEESEPSESEI